MHRIAIILTLVAAPAAAIAESPSTIRSDERVVFYPTAASLSADGTKWTIPIHVHVFEPSESETLQNELAEQLSGAVGLAITPRTRAFFNSRIRGFLVDNERGKNVGVRIAGTEVVLDDTEADGQVVGNIQLDARRARQHARDGWLPLTAVVPDDSPRQFAGRIQLVEPIGVTVISDIDDTIKISRVTDKSELLANTFLRPFRAAPGMAELYREWAEAGAVFTYVSSSPWQLYSELQTWTQKEKFPPATFNLQRVRLKDRSLLKLLNNPIESKLKRISAILKRYPLRKFVLVGDSGEKDPEVYGELARTHSGQIASILIRNVTEEREDSERFRTAFKSVPANRWQLFSSVEDIETPAVFDK